MNPGYFWIIVIVVYICLGLSFIGIIWGGILNTNAKLKIKYASRKTGGFFYWIMCFFYWISFVFFPIISFYFFTVWYVMNSQAQGKLYPWDL